MHTMSISRSVCGFQETRHAAAVVNPHQPHAACRLPIDRHGGNRDIGLGLAMRVHHFGEVHAVELVAGKNEHVLAIGLVDVAEILPHRVRGALIPIRGVQRLLGRQNLDKAGVELVEGVRPANVPVQADRVELREHVNPVQPAVDAIRQGNVNQAVLAGQRHGRLRSILRQRI